ncbi:hypothetical protein D3C77_537610 [compost metagenome]
MNRIAASHPACGTCAFLVYRQPRRPVLRQISRERQFILRGKFRILRTIRLKAFIPFLLRFFAGHNHPFSKTIPYFLAYGKGAVLIHAVERFHLPDISFAKRRPVHFGSALILRAVADNRLHLDQGRFLSLLAGSFDGPVDGFQIIAVLY